MQVLRNKWRKKEEKETKNYFQLIKLNFGKNKISKILLTSWEKDFFADRPLCNNWQIFVRRTFNINPWSWFIKVDPVISLQKKRKRKNRTKTRTHKIYTTREINSAASASKIIIFVFLWSSTWKKIIYHYFYHQLCYSLFSYSDNNNNHHNNNNTIRPY